MIEKKTEEKRTQSMVVGPSFGRPITEFHRRKSSYSTKEKAATLRRHSSLVVFFFGVPLLFYSSSEIDFNGGDDLQDPVTFF